MAKTDYYEILGVKRNAPEKEIKQAFRKLARQHHPDVNPGNKSAEERFKEINQAYEILSDADKRKKYDQFGDQWQYADQFARGGAGARPGQRSGPQWRTEYDFGDTSGGGVHRSGRGVPFEDILEDLFRGGGGKGRGFRQQPMRGQDIEEPVDITLEEAFNGTTRLFQMQKPETCPTCQGAGISQNKPCPACGGTGSVMQMRRLEAKIPAGVHTGSRVRLEGEGSPGISGGPPGDLYLIVNVRPHPGFERKGDDLHTEVDVPLTDAILGGEVQVPTLKGKLLLKIPPETQNGKVFRLAGQGMPRLGGTGRGDLFVKVHVVLPTSLSEQEKELFRQIRDQRGGVKV